MKTKIKQDSPKRIKKIESLRKSYPKYAHICDKPIEISVYQNLDYYFRSELYPRADITDLTTLWSSLARVYLSSYMYRYWISEDMEATFAHLRTAVRYYALGFDTFVSGIQPANILVDRNYREIASHEEFLYRAISVGEWELARKYASPCPVIQCMLNEDYDGAKELLLADTEKGDESQETDFIHMPYVKAIYLAILNLDGDAFNEQLAKRINKYRKRPADYQPVIDVTSIAFLKMAKKCGLQSLFSVDEIPEYFLETESVPERSDCKIVDVKRCEAVFKEWGSKIPELEEVREKLF